MNPGVFVMGGGGAGGGSGGGPGRGAAGQQGGSGKNGGNGADGGGKGAGTCGQGSQGRCPNPKHGPGGTAAGDPVDVLTGRVYTLPSVDLALAGPMPLVVRRVYSSEVRARDVGLGLGWTHSLAWEIEQRRRSVVVHTPWGTSVRLDRLSEEGIRLAFGKLTRQPGGFLLVDDEGLGWLFRPMEGIPSRFVPTRVVDADGNVIELVYFGPMLWGITDAVGRRVRVRRLRDGHIAAFEVFDASAGAWVSSRRYEYDRNLLVRAVDAIGGEVRYEYEADGLLTSTTSAGGLRVEYRYDKRGRCIETWAHSPGREALWLDAGVPSKLADGETKAKGLLHAKINRYDDGYLELVTSLSVERYSGAGGRCDRAVIGGGVHTKQFDAAGALTLYEDPLHAVQRFERDADGRLLAAVSPTGAVTRYRYADGALAEVVGPLADAVRFERDARGRVALVADDLGLVAEYTYAKTGQLASAVVSGGAATALRYDGLGNRIEITEPNGASRRVRYDFFGKIIGYTDELDAETRYQYDPRGLLTAIVHPTGAVETFDYDADGNLCRAVDADGRVTELLWGGYRLVHELRRHDGSVVRYRYDREQNLVAILDERGDEHRIERNGAGWVVAERTFDGRRVRYGHDLNGRITSMDVEGQDRTEIVHDPEGRPVERAYADDTRERLEYDEAGRLVRASVGDVESSFEYDVRGRIVKEVLRAFGETYAVSSSFSAAGDRVATSTSEGHEVHVAWDVMGRPVGVTLAGGATVRMERDAMWERARVLPEGGTIQSEVDPLGRVTSVSIGAPAAGPSVPQGQPEWVGPRRGRTFERRYGYSPGGHLTWAHDAVRGGSQELRYDALGRVLEVVVDGRSREAYRYDAAGAVFGGQACSYGSGGRLLRRANIEYRYDPAGRLLEKRDDAGTTTYTWDGRGLLAAVRLADGTTVDFTYDAFARRIQKRVRRGDDLVVETRFRWDGPALVAEREERLQDGAAAVRERLYAYEPGSVMPLAQRDVISDALGRREEPWLFYVCSRQNGFPEALIDARGNVVETIEHSLWGRTSAARTTLRYQGQYEDVETGLFYNGQRYYDPETGQFLSPEPRSLEGSLKPYAYVDGFPLRWVDLDGSMRSTVNSTRANGKPNRPAEGASGGAFPLHPAVVAALPPSDARDPELAQRFSPPPGSCSEPAALSERLYEYQRRTGRMCYPTHPGDTAWQQNLHDALGEVERAGPNAISSADEQGAAAACPNCSQMIARLWTLGNRTPPNNLVAPGRETGVGPSRNPQDNVRTSRASEQFMQNAAANAGTNAAVPATRPVQPGMGKIQQGPQLGTQNYPAPHPFPQQNLGVWTHNEDAGWQRVPGT
ncbi:uncharacterized protein SOCE26_048510 [Sorangium cellulosum]|uniref:Uncharacterized protein n=2 Tax=Sorangium cellulosum TaxID=56 RepID=A0A2L0EVR9_SORCE|nr:uncharacterized protein SOCE26_048510 [Sorangium cellulosum]